MVVTVTFVVLEPRALSTTNDPSPTAATVPKAALPKPNPPPPKPPRADPLGRAEGRNDGRALGFAPPKPPARVQLPDVAVIITLVAVRAVTGARLAPAL